MPTQSTDAAENAIVDKIVALTEAIEPDLDSSFNVDAAPKIAAAVALLAEARAWLRVPNQAHGSLVIAPSSE